jgi:hypothetical protein
MSSRSARLLVAAAAIAGLAAATQARAENARSDYFDNLQQYQYNAPQPVQRDWRTVQKQVATAPGSSAIKNNRGKDVGYAWVGGKVGSRAFDDPDLARSNNFSGGLSTEPGGGDPDLLPTDQPGGGVLNLWMRF